MNTRDFLNERHVAYELLDQGASKDAASVVHAPARNVAKAVLLRANHGYRYLTAILPAAEEIDFHGARLALGDCQLQLATEEEVRGVCAACEPGVVPPFGSLYGVQTIVDTELAKEDEIIFEGNSDTQPLRMKFDDFRRLEVPLVIPLTRVF
jgi:Ala-tRNA(Pro) deacylase